MEINIVLSAKKIGLTEDLLKKTYEYLKSEILCLGSCPCKANNICLKCKMNKIEILRSENNESEKRYKHQIKKMLPLQQQKALQWLNEGINFFFTGGAGCGKSYIVKEITQSKQIYKTIHITASTRIAAHLLNGVTIHAFTGIDTACEIKLCYDELLSGIQVIACGDFFQLPPIKGEFVFKSKIWRQYMTQVLVLTECF
ncbi:ATP-dependent DNA helicase PIF1-like [Hydra vulgaris]|uniref:ATP-dependent DNA helicase n=1 Tax=Hydra vulgaris TaxID=6087 RepID=A0ABM4BPA5_HYDVU